MNFETFILFLMITLASCYYPYIQNKNVIPKYKTEYIPKRHFYYRFQSYSNDLPKLPEYLPEEYTDDISISNNIAQFSTDYIPKPHLVQWHLKTNPTHVESLLKKSDQVPVSINRRIGIGDGSVGDTEMCKSRKEIITLPVGLTKDSIWKHVFNNGEYGIEAVFCEKPGGNCVMDLPGLKMTCEQKYVYKVLVALDGSGNITDEFQVPAGCICKYKRP